MAMFNSDVSNPCPGCSWEAYSQVHDPIPNDISPWGHVSPRFAVPFCPWRDRWFLVYWVERGASFVAELSNWVQHHFIDFLVDQHTHFVSQRQLGTEKLLCSCAKQSVGMISRSALRARTWMIPGCSWSRPAARASWNAHMFSGVSDSIVSNHPENLGQ